MFSAFAENQEFARLLLAHGANADAINKDGISALTIAAGVTKNEECTKLLLKNGACFDGSNGARLFPLETLSFIERMRQELQAAEAEDYSGQEINTTSDAPVTTIGEYAAEPDDTLE
jgi:ankyrin repeat protein